MRADFGGVPDQAAYQAAVCLVGDGKPKEAEAEFVRFLRERPLSPLCHAAYGRLKRLLRGSFESALESQLGAEREAFCASAGTHDFAEGVAAFFERRKPRFAGR